jgi:hypothetical protein
MSVRVSVSGSQCVGYMHKDHLDTAHAFTGTYSSLHGCCGCVTLVGLDCVQLCVCVCVCECAWCVCVCVSALSVCDHRDRQRSHQTVCLCVCRYDFHAQMEYWDTEDYFTLLTEHAIRGLMLLGAPHPREVRSAHLVLEAVWGGCWTRGVVAMYAPPPPPCSVCAGAVYGKRGGALADGKGTRGVLIHRQNNLIIASLSSPAWLVNTSPLNLTANRPHALCLQVLHDPTSGSSCAWLSKLCCGAADTLSGWHAGLILHDQEVRCFVLLGVREGAF